MTLLLITTAPGHARSVHESRSMFDLENELSTSNGAVAVFYASWCPHCKDLLPVFASLAQQYGEKGPNFVQVDADQYTDVGEAFEVEGYPTVRFFQKVGTEKEYDDYEGGADHETLKKFIDTHAENKLAGIAANIQQTAASNVLYTTMQFDRNVHVAHITSHMCSKADKHKYLPQLSPPSTALLEKQASVSPQKGLLGFPKLMPMPTINLFLAGNPTSAKNKAKPMMDPFFPMGNMGFWFYPIMGMMAY